MTIKKKGEKVAKTSNVFTSVNDQRNELQQFIPAKVLSNLSLIQTPLTFL
jgi:hypothetical protein